MITNHLNIIRIMFITVFILLIPLVAMQFTDEVVWDLADFIVAGVLLFGAGLTFELVVRRFGNNSYRIAVGLAVSAALFLVWANLAVGLIGTEDNPINLVYAGVLSVGIIGAILVRLQPTGMARTLFAMAITQFLVTTIALFAGSEQYSGSSLIGIVNINVFFVALWVGSGFLFQRASTTDSK